MRITIAQAALAGLLAVSQAPALAADARSKINFQDQVSTIFKNRCNACHNADKQKGGLNLENYASALQGGGSGKVVEPGDAEASTLFQLVSHNEEPNMPPNAPKIPDAEIETLRAWIDGGALETSGSVAVVKARPKFEFKLDPEAAGKPVGPPAMPEDLATEPVVPDAKPTAVIALAHSPWAPLLAIGGHKQVVLYETVSRHLAGILPFPEGTVYDLKFSRSGALLLAAGGRGGQSGLAVAWDVKTGKRVFEVGKEYDVVLAADISPDHGLVALGGPSKVLRVYSTADGQLLYEQKKHTEWITAVEFSPDGVLLASGDRNNGLLVWEAATGREFYDLRGHNLAITDVSWRLDSNVLASSSEDGTLKLWEMESGKTIKSVAAHPGGVASVGFAKDGRLVTAGRDRMVRLWDPAGAKQRDFERFGDVALEAVFTHDALAVAAGDWSGEVRLFGLKDGKRLANLVSNPAPVAARLARAEGELAAASKTFESAQRAQQTAAAKKDAADRAVAAARAEVEAAAAALAKRKQELERATAVRAAAEKALASTRPPVDQAKARLESLKAERDALSLEKKSRKNAPAVATPTADAGS